MEEKGGGGHLERNHRLSEQCLSKLQKSRKLMLFDVLTMMKGGSVFVLYAALYGFGYIVPGCTRRRACVL